MFSVMRFILDFIFVEPKQLNFFKNMHCSKCIHEQLVATNFNLRFLSDVVCDIEIFVWIDTLNILELKNVDILNFKKFRIDEVIFWNIIWRWRLSIEKCEIEQKLWIKILRHVYEENNKKTSFTLKGFCSISPLPHSHFLPYNFTCLFVYLFDSLLLVCLFVCESFSRNNIWLLLCLSWLLVCLSVHPQRKRQIGENSHETVI